MLTLMMVISLCQHRQSKRKISKGKEVYKRLKQNTFIITSNFARLVAPFNEEQQGIVTWFYLATIKVLVWQPLDQHILELTDCPFRRHILYVSSLYLF